MDIETIKKVRIRTSLKTDARVYPRGTILEAPFPDDIVRDIEAEANTIEFLWVAEESEVETVDEPIAAVDPEAVVTDGYTELEDYIQQLGVRHKLDRRKKLPKLREEVRQLIKEKAVTLGDGLDKEFLTTDVGLDVLMKQYLELEKTVKAIEDDI